MVRSKLKFGTGHNFLIYEKTMGYESFVKKQADHYILSLES